MDNLSAEKLVRKTIDLDARAIKKARQIFDVTTDKEAVNKALWLIAEEDDIITTHEQLAGTVDLEDLFK